MEVEILLISLSGKSSVPPPTSSGGSSVGVGDGLGLASGVDDGWADGSAPQPVKARAVVKQVANTVKNRRMNLKSRQRCQDIFNLIWYLPRGISGCCCLPIDVRCGDPVAEHRCAMMSSRVFKLAATFFYHPRRGNIVGLADNQCLPNSEFGKAYQRQVQDCGRITFATKFRGDCITDMSTIIVQEIV